MSEGMLDDAALTPAMEIVNAAPLSEEEVAHVLMTSPADDGLTMSSSIDDPGESHVMMSHSENAMMMSTHDV